MKKDLVSIITTTRNLFEAKRVETFKQCLESVHSQTHENIEHLIIDADSNDGTKELLDSYEKKGWIKYISEPDSGIYNAMNKGIRRSKGEYIAFLNSDDYYHNKQAVELSVSALKEQKADFSFADLVVTGGEKEYVERGDLSRFLYLMPFGHPTMFTKKSVLLKEGGFDEGLGLPADYDLVIRLIFADYKPVYVNREIATYRIGGLGSSTDHSNDIGKIYLKNYSHFFPLSDVAEAKNIMYASYLPRGFTESFKKFAEGKRLKNISIEDVYRNLNKKTINRETIPVFLSSDNRYSPLVATTILSIMENTDSFVEFFILDGGIWEEFKLEIKTLCANFANCSIEFIKVDAEVEFKGLPVRLHFTRDMYARFLIPRLRPRLEKVIYSDVDVIFNDDIRKLYEEDLGKYPLGAVPYNYGYLNPDQSQINEFHDRLNLSKKHQYFESGLLLIDCEKWRKEGYTEKLINQTGLCHADSILTPDQDVLNKVFECNYKKLDNKYIVVPDRVNVLVASDFTREAIRKPFIYHFAGASKPWLFPKVLYAEKFWQYAIKTSFYPLLRKDLKKIMKDEYIKKPKSPQIYTLIELAERVMYIQKIRWLEIKTVKLDDLLPKMKKVLSKILPGFLKSVLKRIFARVDRG